MVNFLVSTSLHSPTIPAGDAGDADVGSVDAGVDVGVDTVGAAVGIGTIHVT